MTQDSESTFDSLTSLPPAIAAALVDAQTRIAWVGKDGWNKHQEFKYATSEAMIAEGRAALNAAGLAITGGAWAFAANPDTTSPMVGRVHVAYCMIHVTGEMVKWEASTPVVAGKGRPEDKAEFIAITECLAYVLRGMLLIPRGDAPDDIAGRDDSETQVKRPQTREAPSPPRDRTDPIRAVPPPDRTPACDNCGGAIVRNVAHVCPDSDPQVPFAKPGEVSGKSAPVDHDADMVRAILASVAKKSTVAELKSGLAQADTLPLSDASQTTVRQAVAMRMIKVAATPAELAESGTIAKSLRDHVSEQWSAAHVVAYKAARASLPKVPA